MQINISLVTLSEEIVKFYQNKVPSIIVRLSNIYGYTELRRLDLIPTIMAG